MVSSQYDALLFDLGGVVIDIDFERVFASWAAHAAIDARLIKSRFSFDDAYKRHEIGKIGIHEYFSSLRHSLGIDLTDDQFLEGWNAIFVDEIPGVSGLLAKAAQSTRLFAFSNSKFAHEQYWSRRFANTLAHFSEIFVSSKIGLRKPNAEAFAFVVDAMGVPAQRVVFFDDLHENVESARKFGMNAVHITSNSTLPDFMAGRAG